MHVKFHVPRFHRGKDLRTGKTTNPAPSMLFRSQTAHAFKGQYVCGHGLGVHGGGEATVPLPPL